MVNKTIPSPHNTCVNPKSRPNHTTSSYYDQCFRRTLLVCKINIMQMVRITSCISSDNRISSLFTFFLVINLSVPPVCDFKFTKEPSQHTHMQVHTEEKPFSCKVCFRLIPLVCKTTIMQMVYLISYMSPSNIIPLLFTIFLVKNLYMFTECDFKYTNEPNQHTHMSIHSEEKPISCSVCDCNSNKQIKYIPIHTGVISTYTNKYKFDLANISIIILLIIMKNNYISNG